MTTIMDTGAGDNDSGQQQGGERVTTVVSDASGGGSTVVIVGVVEREKTHLTNRGTDRLRCASRY